jgi:hypothetical protein
MCESFFATLECELLDRRRFKTQSEAAWQSSSSSKAGTIPIAAIPPSTIFHRSTTKGFSKQKVDRKPNTVHRNGVTPVPAQARA